MLFIDQALSLAAALHGPAVCHTCKHRMCLCVCVCVSMNSCARVYLHECTLGLLCGG